MQSGLIRKWWWLVLVIVFDIWLFTWLAERGSQDPERKARGLGCDCGRELSRAVEPVAESAPPPLIVTFPTAQTNLVHTNDASVFMPTASGRVQSALYGTVRTRSVGGRLMPAFHEGLDIAPLERDRRGRALDAVHAIADGTVVHASRSAGNSSYGRYVVARHADPIGPVYSLYAHLAEIEGSVKAGTAVGRGARIGVMGNSSTLGIPARRAHLHLEMGLMLNRDFGGWCRGKKIRNPHSLYHGWNLTGIDPLMLFRTTAREQVFSMGDCLSGAKTAFELAVAEGRALDYFALYPGLWHGDGPPSGAIVASVSHGGVILGGREATAEERGRLGGRNAVVLSVNRAELGRNGRRLIVEKSGKWQLSTSGKQWLDILTH